MLKKQYRLAKIYKDTKGKRFSSTFFNLVVSEGEEKTSRFGFIVSKKVSKSAVLRNKTKRVLSKAVEGLIEEININKDILVISKKELGWEKIDEVKKCFTDIFNKAKILK